MIRMLGAWAAGVAAVSLSLPLAAVAAPSIPDDPITPVMHTPSAFELDKVLVVRNWVLCVSQPSAETMARAQEESSEAAQRAYDELAHAKTCGRLAQLGVMLRKQLYPAVNAPQKTRVFSASVNLGGGWMNAFVVSADLIDSE